MGPRWPGIGGVTGQLIFLLLSSVAIIFFKLGTGELMEEFRERDRGCEEEKDELGG